MGLLKFLEWCNLKVATANGNFVAWVVSKQINKWEKQAGKMDAKLKKKMEKSIETTLSTASDSMQKEHDLEAEEQSEVKPPSFGISKVVGKPIKVKMMEVKERGRIIIPPTIEGFEFIPPPRSIKCKKVVSTKKK